MSEAADAEHLRTAARLALRGHGGAEPNPMVGCVIVERGGAVAGWGYHRRCGGPHAEIEALRRAGARAAGATAYVTLEPCNHAGRTGPCAEALRRAGIARVVYARRDPHPEAGGGAAALAAAGIPAELCERCPEAARASDPFVRRVTCGLPWVTVKWAQTVDGRIATRTGESRWISGPRSRLLVHRERARVDCIMTGIGTVLADDPMLTARGVRLRRVARRLVIDPRLELPPDSQLVATIHQAPLSVACLEAQIALQPRRAADLRAAGADVLPVPGTGRELPLERLLRAMAKRYETTHVLVEAGPGLVGRLFRQSLVNEAWVFVAPMMLGDEQAPSGVHGMNVGTLAEGTTLALKTMRRRGGDVVLRYRIVEPGSFVTAR
jgi:diaminohydroxyphosphoribosylaminopyrimidine deaminase/5-amino-6-(5-phosphoribosylamino)uracil reductase